MVTALGNDRSKLVSLAPLDTLWRRHSASRIMARDARMAGVCRGVDWTETDGASAEAGGATCGGVLCRNRLRDSDAAAARRDVQPEAGVSRLDRRAAPKSCARDDPAGWLDGGRVLAISEIHAGEYRADRPAGRIREFRRGASARQGRPFLDRTHERVGTGAFRAGALRPSAALSGAADR